MANITQNTIINEQVYVYPNADALYRKDIRTIGKREIKRDNITLAEAIPIALALGCFLIVAYEGTYILKGKGENYEKVKANLGKSTRKPTSLPVISYLIKQEVIDAYNRTQVEEVAVVEPPIAVVEPIVSIALADCTNPPEEVLEIIVKKIKFNGQEYLKTIVGNDIYDIESMEVIGTWDNEKQLIIFAEEEEYEENISDITQELYEDARMDPECVKMEEPVKSKCEDKEQVPQIDEAKRQYEEAISEKDNLIAKLRSECARQYDENETIRSERDRLIEEGVFVRIANERLSESNNKLSEANKVLSQENKQLKVFAEECAAFKGEFYKKSREVEELTGDLTFAKQRVDSYKKMVHVLTS
jgi:hypothetical protein